MIDMSGVFKNYPTMTGGGYTPQTQSGVSSGFNSNPLPWSNPVLTGSSSPASNMSLQDIANQYQNMYGYDLTSDAGYNPMNGVPQGANPYSYQDPYGFANMNPATPASYADQGNTQANYGWWMGQNPQNTIDWMNGIGANNPVPPNPVPPNPVPPDPTPHGGGGGGGGGGNGGGGGGGGGTPAKNPWFGTQYGQTQFQYPDQMNSATDIFNTLGRGQPVQTPGQWNTATNVANYYGSNGGQPTSADPWYQSAVQNANYNITDAINQAKEQAGMGGMRWSTPLGRTAQQVAGQQMASIAPQYAQLTQTALENAANRQMQAGQQAYQVGAGQAGLSTDAMNRMLQSGQGLTTLGQQAFQMPYTTAMGLMGQGTQGQQNNQNMANQWYSQWQQQQPYNNPWLNVGMGTMGTQGASQYQPNMYQPSTGTSILGGLTSLLPMLGMTGLF